MLIFTKNVNWGLLKRKVHNPEEAVDYVCGLVPKWAQHLQNIQNNQRYYAAVYMRNVYTLPYRERMTIVKALTDGISLTGLTSGFVALDEVIASCNKENLLGALLEVSDNAAEAID